MTPLLAGKDACAGAALAGEYARHRRELLAPSRTFALMPLMVGIGNNTQRASRRVARSRDRGRAASVQILSLSV